MKKKRNGQIHLGCGNAQESESNGCKSNYAIYVSGVGTRFNGELNIFQRALVMMQDHSGFGLGVGTGGTRRLDYGEDQLNDALKQVMILNAKKIRNRHR